MQGPVRPRILADGASWHAPVPGRSMCVRCDTVSDGEHARAILYHVRARAILYDMRAILYDMRGVRI